MWAAPVIGFWRLVPIESFALVVTALLAELKF